MFKDDKILFIIFFILLFVTVAEVVYYFFLKPASTSQEQQTNNVSPINQQVEQKETALPKPLPTSDEKEYQSFNLINSFSLDASKTKIEDGTLIINTSDNEAYGHIAPNPIMLNSPFKIRIKFKKDRPGNNAQLSLYGRLRSEGSKKWWEGIHAMFITDLTDKVMLEFRDGKSPEVVGRLFDKIIPGNTFHIRFLDTFGKQFSIIDSQGNVIQIIDVTKLDRIELSQGLFPEEKLWPGFMVDPGTKLTIEEFMLSFNGN